jgi:hypothetical protein
MNYEDLSIDELLNSFIDGELTDEQRNKVERLIAEDAKLAQRLHQLEKCKILVGALPRANAPAGMLEQVKAALQRNAVAEQQAVFADEREGTRKLVVRGVLATAAMIAFVAVLAALLHVFVGPEAVPQQPFAGEHRPSVAGATKFSGRLEFDTDALIAADAVIKRAIEDSGLSGCATSRSLTDRRIYSLSCSKEHLNVLLTELAGSWGRFGSARLVVQTEEFGEPIVVESVATEQIAEIIAQESYEGCIEVAKDFAVLNSMARLLHRTEVSAVMHDRLVSRIDIPKPVLTRREEAATAPVSPDSEAKEVDLAIVIAASK